MVLGIEKRKRAEAKNRQKIKALQDKQAQQHEQKRQDKLLKNKLLKNKKKAKKAAH
jgi:hypothetical protein